MLRLFRRDDTRTALRTLTACHSIHGMLPRFPLRSRHGNAVMRGIAEPIDAVG
jgi:hypothetical protein